MHEHLFYLRLSMSSEYKLHDTPPRLIHFLKSPKRGNCLTLCLYGQMSSHTEFQLPIAF